MTKLNTNNLMLKIACALLLHNKELSINEIKALPSVDDETVEIIKHALLNMFNAYIYQKKIPYLDVPHWEEFIILRENN